ncbi:MAG: polysulfide reductase NrfD [Deltaproteobacteria bacterium]|nr:polysulfide reductase NrfD [Deltaproteobacteria bacterium]
MNLRKTPHIQKVWGWKVALHLFLAGTGAGLYLTGIVQCISGAPSQYIHACRTAVIASSGLIFISMIFIFSHLGYKTNAFRAFTRASSSWLARGSIIVPVFLILELLYAAILSQWDPYSQDLSSMNVLAGGFSSIFAVLTLYYSGMLLKALRPFPFWNTWLLPLLFALSGISSGIMALAFLTEAQGLFTGRAIGETKSVLFYFTNLVIPVQAMVLGLFLMRSFKSPGTRSSFLIMTRGHNAVFFWMGVVMAGLAVPFASGIYLVSGPSLNPGLMSIWVFVCTGLGIIGGYLLRYTLLTSGTGAPVNVRGKMVPLPGDARVPSSMRVK